MSDVGSKPGSAPLASSMVANRARKDRLRDLAMDTIDVSQDPYMMMNHLGQFECRLCMTVHPTIANYLAHTQGKRHQEALARRAAKMKAESEQPAMPKQRQKIAPRKTQKIGTPGYKVVKQKASASNQLSLLFRIHYPEIETDLQPRYRFMSAFEQRVEQTDTNYQYILFAAEPYETVAFKIPNKKVDKSADKFLSHWDEEKKTYTLQLHFELSREEAKNLRIAESAKTHDPFAHEDMQENQSMDTAE